MNADCIIRQFKAAQSAREANEAWDLAGRLIKDKLVYVKTVIAFLKGDTVSAQKFFCLLLGKAELGKAGSFQDYDKALLSFLKHLLGPSYFYFEDMVTLMLCWLS